MLKHFVIVIVLGEAFDNGASEYRVFPTLGAVPGRSTKFDVGGSGTKT